MASFAIEVPGEANPLTENLLVQTLRSASSSDPNQIQTGTKQLQQWEKEPGFYRHLQSAYIDQRLPHEIRYLAIIQLKNGIDKYWRKTAQNAVPKDDKEVIRKRLIPSCLSEPDQGLALQNSLVIAKITRHEYPQDWPTVLSEVLESLRSSSQTPPLQLARALLALLHIVKELSTGRLQRSRQNLQAATPEIVHVLSNLYAEITSFWRSRLSADPVQAADSDISNAMSMGLLAIKVLRRLLVIGYDHPNRNEEVSTFWSTTQDYLAAFMNLRGTTPSNVLLEKNMLQLAKLHHGMARDHPAAFSLLPNTLDMISAYWSVAKSFGDTFGSKEAVTSAMNSARIGHDGDADDSKSLTEKLALRGLLILRACVKMVHHPAQSFKYKSAEDKDEKRRATELIKQNILTPSFVQEVMEVVVTKYFVFRASDLREWEEEPEEWEKREEGDGEDWEFSIRSCSEKLFLDLAINHKEMLQPLLQVFYSVATPDNEDILFKDSLYTAIGLAAPVLHEHLDFDAFLRDVLVVEIQKQKPGFGIIRRRAAILIGQWITVKLTQFELVYQTFQHLLNREDRLNDQVVRVTAGRQLSKVADVWEFDVQLFLPFANATLTHLMQLIEEVELTETKIALLNTISVLVEKLAHNVAPYAERIVSILPLLWDESGEVHILKQAILALLARLVTAMKAQSTPLHPISFPIIKGAVEPGAEVWLLDDAMDLWKSILTQSSSPATPGVLELVPYLFPLYELETEVLRQALEITESYVLLAPESILTDDIRTPMFAALTPLIGQLRPEANGLVCNLVEVIIRAAQQLGGAAAVEQIAADLVQSGLFGKLLSGLRGSWVAHCTTGPRAERAPVDGIVETDYFAIFARMILGSVNGFCQACQVAGPAGQPTGSDPALESTMKWLLEEWFNHFENIGDPSRRKLMALALTRLLETNQSWILVNLQSLISVWTDTITELREGAEDATGDSLVYNSTGPLNNEEPEAPEDGRRRQLTNSDVVHTTRLPEFVKEHLQNTIANLGPSTFQDEWMANVDKDVLAAFGQLGIM